MLYSDVLKTSKGKNLVVLSAILIGSVNSLCAPQIAQGQEYVEIIPETKTATQFVESETITSETVSNPIDETKEIDLPNNNASEKTTSAVSILSPTVNSILDQPAVTVVVQYPRDAEIELRVNGQPVDPKLIGRTETNSATQLITQTWYAVPLQAGTNSLSANLLGQPETLTTTSLQVRGQPSELMVATRETSIDADARSTAIVQGQLQDDNGNLANWDGTVTLSTSAGEFVEPDQDLQQPGFQVKVTDGKFRTILRSTLEAQTVTIRANTRELEAYTQLQFKTALRPSLVSGVVNIRLGAGGTDFYDSFQDFLPLDEDDDFVLDFSSAVFATFPIGEWLFTGAYNNQRPLNLDCNCDNRLFRNYQASENQYPIYGDDSTSEILAPSIDSLYLRLERSSPVVGAAPDYVMWGDYNTSEFANPSQFFTATTRQLHGFKGNYNLGNLQVSGFYANNTEGFQRDILNPDGTSGIYFLSQRLLVPGSEDVFIELEELTRPGTVLQRERLSRGADYEIDYDRGTLNFREPLLRTDIDAEGNILVRRLVVSYQFEDGGEDTKLYGGRLRYHLSRNLNQESWLGATYLKEEQGVRDFELYGADVLLSLGEKGRFTGEYAHSRHNSPELGATAGSAYRLLLEGEVSTGIAGRLSIH